MDSKLVAEIIAKNKTDIETIISTIGIGNLLTLMPHILAILQTIQDVQKTPATA